MAKQKVDVNLKVFLSDFGLSEREIVLYLALLKTGPNTIMNLSRETGIKRSTTHNNVEELIKKGLVSQTNYGERRMVVAEAPEKLKFLIEQKKWSVKKMEEGMPEVIKLIENLVPVSEQKTAVEVKYYEGRENVHSVYEQTLEAKEVYSFANLDKYYEIFPQSLGLQQKATEKKMQRKVRDILVDSPISREIAKRGYKNYQVKFISSEIFSGFDIIIYENKVAMIQLEQENLYAIVIESQAISQGLKALHESMWKLLG